MTRKLVLAVLVCFASIATAQQFEFPAAAAQDDSALSQAIARLATQVIAVYQESDRETYLENLFRLQMVAGQYENAADTIVTLRRLSAPKIPGGGEWINVQYEIFARAKVAELAQKVLLEEAYRQAFRNQVGHFDDATSFLVIRSMGAGGFDGALKRDRNQLNGKTSLTLAEALKLIRDYQASDSYRQFTPLAKPLIEEDNARRYVIGESFPVKIPNGATICTLVIRPRTTSRLPALLTFTIYTDGKISNLAMMAASRGYVGIVGMTRGKQCSPDTVEPYRHDGADAAALIDWIAEQPWSDGRVGLYGGSYSGFTSWATAKYMPKALKAIVVGAAAAPGIDVPMEGNVVWNFVYPWPFYTTDNKGLDDETYNQFERWQKLNHDWYLSGRAYFDLDKIDGKPNPIFDEWISHPSYDAYWQQVIPFDKEFARIHIPVLQTAGYYFGGPGAAVYYFTQQIKHDPGAEHYLLIGPYHHFGAQVGVVGLTGNIFPSLAGLELDPVALINIEDIRFQFFDWKLKNGRRPELLEDRVNYQVVGANIWKHAPTLDAMADGKLRFYLTSGKSGTSYSLSSKPMASSFVNHTVNLADRSDVDRQPVGGGIVSKELDTWNGLEFISDPLPAATEMSGLFSGWLDFVANKKDFDFEIDIYELTAKGEYIQLVPYWARASYVGNLSQRRLLAPGKREHLDFTSVRLMSRWLQAGSKVVVVLSVIKTPGRQINYGTGKDVSHETIQDATVPLEIKWFGDSYLDFPVRR